MLERLHFPQPIQNRDFFFNREKEVEEVTHFLRGVGTSSVTIIKGERLVGKTSLLNVALESLSASSQIIVRLPPVASREDLLREILEGVAGHLDRTYPVSEAIIRSLTAFSKALKRLLGDYIRRVYIVLDELDSVLYETSEEKGRQLVQALQYLIETLPELRFLLTMSHIPASLVRSYASPFATGAPFVTLRLWDREQSDGFLLWLGEGVLRYDAVVLEAFYRLGGGHPYFLKAILKALLEAQPPSPRLHLTDPEEVQRAAWRALREPNVNLAVTNLWEAHFTPQEQQILKRLAHSEGPLPLENLIRGQNTLEGVVRQLEERQYVRRGGFGVEMRLGILGYWLQMRSGEGVEAPPSAEGIFVDLKRGKASVDGREVSLTSQDVRLLSLLLARQGETVRKDDLIRALWPNDEEALDSRLAKAVNRLRRKLGDGTRGRNVIETVRGTGYRLRQDTVQVVE